MYLVDTDVLLADSPDGQVFPLSLVEWMEVHSDELFVSAVTVAEISEAIAKLERTGSRSRAAGLRDWLELVLHLYGERVLPFDASAARLAGELMDEAHSASPTCGLSEMTIPAAAGDRRVTVLTPNPSRYSDSFRHSPLGIGDIAIAATASTHGLTILTRRPYRFRPLEVPAIDPFETLP